jgi:hypothetical protein
MKKGEEVTMQSTLVRGVNLTYEMLGDSGPFHQGSGHPVAGLAPEEMRSITLPALIIPGNDHIHPRAPGQAAHRLMPNSEYREVMGEDVDVDVDFDGWAKKNATLAAYFIDFLRRCERTG